MTGQQPEIGTGRTFARKVAGGAAITMGGQLAKVIVQFGGVILLARLLSPKDYGLMAMVTAIIGIGEILRDFGLSSAAIQAARITREEKDNLFWTNTAIGVAMGALVFVFAGRIADFYNEPALRSLSQALALTFVFNGATTQFRANLGRELKFGHLAFADITGQLSGLAAGVIAALAGMGYWALVLQQVVQSAAMLLTMAIAARWLPGLPHRGTSIRGYVRFGWHLVASQLLGYVGSNVGQVVIGYRLGSVPLGLYNRAFALLMMPLNQINAPASTVALPVLSRLQGDRERYSAFLLRGQTVMVHFVVALFAMACAQAAPLIELVLGSKWSMAAPIFQILTIGGIFQVASYATYWVFVSKGLTHAQLRFSMLSRGVQIAAILIGSLWGLTGVAVGYAFGLAVAWPLGLWWIGRLSDAPVRAMAGIGLRAMAGYGICAALSWLAARTWHGDHRLIELGVGIAAAAVAFGALCAAWPSFRRDIAAILHSRSLLRGAA